MTAADAAHPSHGPRSARGRQRVRCMGGRAIPSAAGCVAILLVCVSLIGARLPVAVAGTPEASAAFAPTWTRNGITLSLRGAGMLTYLGFYRVLEAGLYLPAGTPSDRALSDIARRIEIHYLNDYNREDFMESTRISIRKNLTPEDFERMLPRIDRFNDLYESVNRGDSYALTYIPGLGTSLELNGAIKGVIPGSDFAAALFAIWLGDQPLAPRLRDALLGTL